MRSMFRYGGVMLALVVLVTAFASAQNPAKPPADPKATAPQTGEISGKVMMVGGSSKTLTVEVEYQAYEANPAAQRNTNNSQLNNLYRLQAEIQRDQMDIMRARNPRDQMRRMQELQRDMARLQMEMARLGATPQQSPFKVVTKKQAYEIQADESTKVRHQQLPLVFDEKGNPKKHTDSELKELKGTDPRLPGYQGSFDQLKPGHLVRIALGKPGKPATKDSKDLDKDPTALDATKPYAVLILVTGETEPPRVPGKKK